VTAGAPFTRPGETGETLEAWHCDDGKEIGRKAMEDCTHFTSCCLGQPYDRMEIIRLVLDQKPRSQWPRETSGGMKIPQQDVGSVYLCGFVGAPQMVTWLKTVGTVIGKELQPNTGASIFPKGQLEPGDVIAYGNNEDLRDRDKPPEERRILPYAYYQHCTIHLGDGNIACHSVSRWNSPWSDIDLPFVTFIHIR
jgi:hypothetical protein